MIVRRWWSWLALLVLAAAGCRPARTELVVVVVTSDFYVPAQLDQLQLTVDGPAGRQVDTTAQLAGPGAVSLPATLGLALAGDEPGPVVVSVTGLLGARAVVRRTVRTSFVPGARRAVVVPLRWRCALVQCADAAMTCGDANVCASPEVPAASLPPWSTELLASPDAGAPAAPSCALYASPGGRDPAPGTRDAPFGSIAQLVRALRPGQAGCLLAGHYAAQELVDAHAADTVVVRAEPGAVVELDGLHVANVDHVRFEGLRFTGPVVVNDPADRVELAGSELTTATNPVALAATNGGRITNTRIERCHVHDIGAVPPRDASDGRAIQMLGPCAATTIRDNLFANIADDVILGGGDGDLVEGNVFRDTGAHPQGEMKALWHVFGSTRGLTFRANVAQNVGAAYGAYFQFSGPATPYQDTTIENNLFDHAARLGAFAVSNTVGLRVANNTVVGDGVALALTYDPAAARGAAHQIVNNVFDAPTSIRRGDTAGVADYNVLAGEVAMSAPGAHDVIGRSPTYVNAAAGDYRLAPGSVGVDAGTLEGAPLLDLLGNARVGPVDIGCYEATR